MTKLLLLFLLAFSESVFALPTFCQNESENLTLIKSIIDRTLDSNHMDLDHFAFNTSINGERKACLVQFSKMLLARKNHRNELRRTPGHDNIINLLKTGKLKLTHLEGDRYLFQIDGYRCKQYNLYLQISFHDSLPEPSIHPSALKCNPPKRATALPQNFGLSILIPSHPELCKSMATLMHLVERITTPKDMWEVIIFPVDLIQLSLFEKILSSKGLENFHVSVSPQPRFSHMAFCYPGMGHLIDPVAPTLEALKTYEIEHVLGTYQKAYKFGDRIEIIEDPLVSDHESGWFVAKTVPNLNYELPDKNAIHAIISMTNHFRSPKILYIDMM